MAVVELRLLLLLQQLVVQQGGLLGVGLEQPAERSAAAAAADVCGRGAYHMGRSWATQHGAAV